MALQSGDNPARILADVIDARSQLVAQVAERNSLCRHQCQLGGGERLLQIVIARQNGERRGAAAGADRRARIQGVDV